MLFLNLRVLTLEQHHVSCPYMAIVVAHASLQLT